MRSPTISVVMPVFNAATFLDEAIRSVLSQTFSDFEFIIINDGSTDTSLEIIKRFQNIDNRIVLRSRENKGIIASLNEGLEIAKGKYIARMDADDISLPNRFRKQVDLFESEKIDICGGHYFLITEKGSINGLNLVPLSHQTCLFSLCFKVPFAHPSVMIRKDFLLSNLLKYGQSPNKKAEDLDLWLRMLDNGAIFGNVDDVILKYRIVSNSLSKKNNRQITHETRKKLTTFRIKNQKKIMAELHNISRQLNTEEEFLVARLCLKYMITQLNLFVLHIFIKINRKTMINSILAEIKNIILLW